MIMIMRKNKPFNYSFALLSILEHGIKEFCPAPYTEHCPACEFWQACKDAKLVMDYLQEQMEQQLPK